MLKKIIHYFFYGIAWGCTCFVLFSTMSVLLSNEQTFTWTKDYFLIQVAASLFSGICCASSCIVYTFKKLSFPQQIAIHFTVGLTGYFIAAYFAKWIPLGNIYAVLLFIAFAVIFFVGVWFSFYLVHKAEAKKLNQKLQNFKSSTKS